MMHNKNSQEFVKNYFPHRQKKVPCLLTLSCFAAVYIAIMKQRRLIWFLSCFTGLVLIRSLHICRSNKEPGIVMLETRASVSGNANTLAVNPWSLLVIPFCLTLAGVFKIQGCVNLLGGRGRELTCDLIII